MNIASRIRRSFFREKTKASDGNRLVNGSSGKEEGKDDILGVTDELIDHVRSFTIDTFKNFSLEDDEEEACVNPCEDEVNGMSSSANVKKDLSDWQEKHAVLVLSKSKSIGGGKLSETSFPYGASSISYMPPSTMDIAEKVAEAAGKLSRNVSMIQRKGYTSDEELEELDSPLTSIVDKGSDFTAGSTTSNARYKLLREVWGLVE